MNIVSYNNPVTSYNVTGLFLIVRNTVVILHSIKKY